MGFELSLHEITVVMILIIFSFRSWSTHEVRWCENFCGETTTTWIFNSHNESKLNMTKKYQTYDFKNSNPWTQTRMFPYASTFKRLPYNESNQSPRTTNDGSYSKNRSSVNEMKIVSYHWFDRLCADAWPSINPSRYKIYDQFLSGHSNSIYIVQHTFRVPHGNQLLFH